MPKAICEDCGSLVEAELTHNGVCAVGHYVHCGWGHQLSPDELISDDVAELVAKLEAKLENVLGGAETVLEAWDHHMRDVVVPASLHDAIEEMRADAEEAKGGKDD